MHVCGREVAVFLPDINGLDKFLEINGLGCGKFGDGFSLDERTRKTLRSNH
jgi:hypothetical protein